MKKPGTASELGARLGIAEMSTTVPVGANDSMSQAQVGQERDLDHNPYISDLVYLGRHLGEVVRRRDAVAAATALRMAPTKNSETTEYASAEFRAGLSEHTALRAARFHAHRKSACNKVALDHYRRQFAVYYKVTARQQRIFDLLMSGTPVHQVRPMQTKGRARSGVARQPLQEKVTTPLGDLRDAGAGPQQVRVAPEVPVVTVVKKPKSKVKPKPVDEFPARSVENYDNEVVGWCVRQNLRDMRAAQKRDEPHPTVENLTLLRADDVHEHGGFEGDVEAMTRRAANYANDQYDPRRLLLEEESGRRGGEKSRRGPVVTVEMVMQEAVKNLSIAEAAKVLGCSPRTISNRRAEIRTMKATESAERIDSRTGEVLAADGSTGPEKTKVGPLRAMSGDLDLSWLAFKDKRYEHMTGRPVGQRIISLRQMR